MIKLIVFQIIIHNVYGKRLQIHETILVQFNSIQLLCLNSISENGSQHNSPQSQVQLEATYELFF